MNITEYSKEIQELSAACDELYSRHDPAVIERLHELLLLADATKDSALTGYVHHRLAAAYYLLDMEYEHFREHLTTAIRLLRAASEDDQIASCYNMIAVDTANHGNYDLAINHFLTAKRFLKNYPDSILPGVIDCNIGNLYGTLNDAGTAFSYELEGMRYIASKKRSSSYYLNYMVSICQMGWYAFETGHPENAQEAYDCLWQLRMDVAMPPDLNEGYPVLIFESRYAYEHDDTEGFQTGLNDLLARVESRGTVYHAVDDLSRFTGFLIEKGFLKEAGRILRILTSTVEDSDILNLKFLATRLAVAYYTATQDETRLHAALQTYHALYLEMNVEKSKSYAFSIDLLSSLDAPENERLQALERDVIRRRQSGIDSLTRLPNHTAFNAYILHAFDNALRHGTGLGIGLIDADHFSALNEQYGHAAGDQALKMIADALRHLKSDQVTCFRFTSDRFVVVYESMSNHDIYSRAMSLKRAVSETPVLVEGSAQPVRLTISQGICNYIPTARTRIWDCFSDASAALRSVKNASRDDIAFFSRKHVF